ncbi:hypothetical protein DFJ58DRAFT_668370, partial [Suillus subalutaceus]|uniref:uncharacterized protein n=1 Tax=Suillus subalutaceus TaxID=48586 RepID=UPI001B871750
IKVSTTGKPNQYGIMAAVGWHRSFDPATDVAFYATKPGKEQIYNTCLTKLPGVAQEYRDRLFTLLPHAGRQIVSESMEGGIPSFDMVSLDQGTTPQRPFANSLTLTHNDFANYLHTDRDHIPIAYGMWWVSKRENVRGPFQFHPQADHYRIPGGSFFWGEYNIGVNFSKAAGLVEIFWRGQKDFHCTMQSHSTNDMTRWGTSVQITAAGVQSVARFNSSNDPTRVRNAGEKQKQMVNASKVCE